MSSQAYAPYRGCGIVVHVTVAKSHALSGACRRFRVSWTVSLPGDTQPKLANFPEQFDFLTEQEAFRYGENRAHTFVDSILCEPAQGLGLQTRSQK